MSDVTEQSISSKVDERYNGWTNYETWLVDLWLTNEQCSYTVLQEICAESMSKYGKAEMLEAYVRDNAGSELPGMVADLVNAAFARVNWVEIVEDNCS